ncbi:helix-turn-helix transcriptional regulator [Fibrobacter sp.]|uniref:helix-turn-helix transcriptional regulator n=1 Tax=Fibrobacter sp. TaxID=35828 RepID=UPI0025C0BFCA|nr:helix-turn-helix transcriptional regulator [Fibrobacter sp.]MCI6438762.1 helix-turn-helix domain-containing protein [Fibrobacter sp.]
MAEPFNARLQRLLSNSGMTQKELAAQAGVTEAAVSHYIKGDRVPRSSVVLKLAETLDVSVDELMGPDKVPDFEDMYRIVARGVEQLSAEERLKLVRVLLKDGKI